MKGYSPIIAEIIIIVSMLVFISFVAYMMPIEDVKSEYFTSNLVDSVNRIHIGIENVVAELNKSVVISYSLPEDVEIGFDRNSFIIRIYSNDRSLTYSIYGIIKIKLFEMDFKHILKDISLRHINDAYIINITYEQVLFNPDKPSYGFLTKVLVLDSFHYESMNGFTIDVRSIG